MASAWSEISHRCAWRFSMSFPPDLQQDAYQEYALSFLEHVGKGMTPEYANYKARLRALIPMRESTQLMRIPEGTWNKGLKDKPENLPSYFHLDEVLPGGQCGHDLISQPPTPPMRAIPWETLNKICSNVELRFVRAIENGMGDREACKAAGYAITAASILRKRIGKNYQEYMKNGTIRHRVALSKRKEKHNGE